MNKTYGNLTFEQILFSAPRVSYDIKAYHKILSPDYPDFLDKYINLPMLQRLQGIGLLCGSDWTPLFKNRMYYSRLDHSVGVALIVWHFTHNKAQTISGLLHDISTPTFSHVSDFRKGDALTQTVTEGPTAKMIRENADLQALLKEDGLTSAMVEDYHIYPIADNEIPQLSADRLEYMFPSGMALEGSWTLPEIERCYNDLTILKNEDGFEELGFKTLEIAEDYCRRFCMTGHILQLNEDKIVLHMLGQIMNMAVSENLLSEEDFMTINESQIIEILDKKLTSKESVIPNDVSVIPNSFRNLSRLYKTFRTMTKVLHTNEPLDENEYFCLNLKVKQRYINPLVNGKRLYDVSEKARQIIDDFKSFEDTKYGCVKLV